MLGGGWQLIRRVPSSNKWHRACDGLGTYSGNFDLYGNFEDDPMGYEEFSIAFDASNVLEVMFATGDGSKWMVVGWEELQNIVWNSGKASLQITMSSESTFPYNVILDSRYLSTKMQIC